MVNNLTSAQTKSDYLLHHFRINLCVKITNKMMYHRKKTSHRSKAGVLQLHNNIFKLASRVKHKLRKFLNTDQRFRHSLMRVRQLQHHSRTTLHRFQHTLRTDLHRLQQSIHTTLHRLQQILSTGLHELQKILSTSLHKLPYSLRMTMHRLQHSLRTTLHRLQGSSSVKCTG